MDFQDGTLVFINATCFIGEQWQAIEEKLAGLQAGSRIILVTRKLKSPQYRLLHQRLWPMSWDKATVSVYLKEK